MKITTLVENRSNTDLKASHGLCFYIETDCHKILFDLGNGDVFLKNAKKRGIDLSLVDTVIISHGHLDHGGGLSTFLQVNNRAKIYIQESAFDKHFAKFLGIKVNVGLDQSLKGHPQVVLINGDYIIDSQLELFQVEYADDFRSPANASLLSDSKLDDFSHEQNLIVHEKQKVCFIGCGHSGVLNIAANIQERLVNICLGGFHLYNPVLRRSVSREYLRDFSNRLSNFSNIKFYTCHCTGLKNFKYLASKSSNIDYISCGQTLEL